MEPVLTFGLGLAQRVDTVRVTWRGGEVEDFGAFDANQQLVLTYGGGVAVE